MGGKTILIMEDDTIQREGLAVVLRREGYTVLVCKEGKEALECLESLLPDLILIDMMIQSPGMDGWDFLEERKRSPLAASIPTLVMTAIGISSQEWAISLGADGLIRKPIEVEQMLAEIRRYLGSE